VPGATLRDAAPAVVDLTADTDAPPPPSSRKRSALSLAADAVKDGNAKLRRVKVEKAAAEGELGAARERSGDLEKEKAAAEDELEDAQDLNRDLNLFQDQKMSEIDALKARIRELKRGG
jgi:hypothetical protein